jgi:hypothetical protein
LKPDQGPERGAQGREQCTLRPPPPPPPKQHVHIVSLDPIQRRGVH